MPTPSQESSQTFLRVSSQVDCYTVHEVTLLPRGLQGLATILGANAAKHNNSMSPSSKDAAERRAHIVLRVQVFDEAEGAVPLQICARHTEACEPKAT